MLWQGRAWVRAEDEQHQPHSQERAGAVTPPGGSTFTGVFSPTSGLWLYQKLCPHRVFMQWL